jgi:uncharacterized protein with von Willebrand factor type A (vWA) domain
MLFDIEFKHRVLSHETSEFGRYLFDRRTSGTVVNACIDELSECIDLSLETDEDIEKYGIHTEGDSSDFVSEVFGRFYEDSIQVNENEWSNVQESLSNLPEYQQLKHTVLGDADMSALATTHVVDLFKEEIANLLKESRKHQEQQDKSDKDGNEPGSIPKFKPSKELQESMNAKGNELKEFQKDLKEAKDTAQAFGDLAADTPKAEGRRQLFENLRNNRSVKEIAKLIGRLRKAMNGLQSIAFSQEQRTQDIDVGRSLNPTDLLNSEQSLLVDDFGTDVFLDRWVKRQQFKWRKKGKDKKSTGPVLVIKDESASMSGERAEYANAFTTAIASITVDDNREFHSLGFNGNITYESMITKKKATWTDRNNFGINEIAPLDALSNLMMRGCNGGTSFDNVLNRSINLLNGLPNGDLIFVTDGCGNISNSVIEDLKKMRDNGLRIFTILIGTSENAVSSISDMVISIDDISSEQSITKLATVMKNSRR